MVYVHPWEVDPDQPRISGSRLSKFRHYRNLDRTAQRLDALLRGFPFAPVRDVLRLVPAAPTVAPKLHKVGRA
jgi:hypothetical protein